MLVAIDIILLIIYSLYIRKLINIIQHEEYSNRKYFGYLKDNIVRIFFKLLIQFVVLTGTYIFIKAKLDKENIFVSIFFIATFILINLINILIDNGKPEIIEYTKKSKLIYISNIVLLQALVLLIIFFLEVKNIIELTYIFSMLLVFEPILIIIGDLIVKPKQKNIDYLDEKRAVQKLKVLPNLIKVAVFSHDNQVADVKDILKTILSQKFNVLEVEGKCTKLKLIQTIIKKLKKKYDILIIDINSEDKKSVKEICEIINPNYALIVSDKEAKVISDAKRELINGIASNGTVFLDRDNENDYELYLENQENKLLYGLENVRGLYAKSGDIEILECESKFTFKCENRNVKCETRLLGLVNISYITGCAAIAKKTGLSMNQIQIGIRKA